MKRAWAKCSECRRSKLKVSKNGSPRISLALQLMNILTQCIPQDRVWNSEITQKCERCRSKNLPCGPNLVRENDPVFTRRADNYHEGQPNNATASPSGFSSSLTTGYHYQSSLNISHGLDGDNMGTTSITFSEEKKGDDDSEVYSSEKLKVEALAKYTIPRTLYDRGLIAVTHQTERIKRLGRISDISVSCFGHGLRTPPG